jgi:transmembrane sensor
MENLSKHQKYLLLGKVTNTLSETEEKELDLLFATNPEAIKQYRELINHLPEESISTSFSEFDDPAVWQEMAWQSNQGKEKTPRTIWLRRVAIAAVTIGIIASSTVYFNSFYRKNSSVAGLQKNVTIKLANGKTIDLASTKGTITDKEITLNNENETLSYENNTTGSIGINSMSVPAGMTYKVILSDGSVVWMNSMTVLDFPTQFTGDSRQIAIAGEAYLEVAKNPLKPFIVKLPLGEIKVTGTEFNVNTYEANISRVALINGKVELNINDSSVIVKPGTEAIYDNNNATTSLEVFDAKKVLSWRQGIFYFEKTSLSSIARVLERWYGIKTEINHSSLADRRFTGMLNKNKPLKTFLDNLKIISKVSASFDKEGILHFN